MIGDGYTFHNRYAMTNMGPVMIRTRKKITATKARNIIEGYVVRFPSGDEARFRVERFGGLMLTFGWAHTSKLLDETTVDKGQEVGA